MVGARSTARPVTRSNTTATLPVIPRRGKPPKDAYCPNVSIGTVITPLRLQHQKSAPLPAAGPALTRSSSSRSRSRRRSSSARPTAAASTPASGREIAENGRPQRMARHIRFWRRPQLAGLTDAPGDRVGVVDHTGRDGPALKSREALRGSDGQSRRPNASPGTGAASGRMPASPPMDQQIAADERQRPSRRGCARIGRRPVSNCRVMLSKNNRTWPSHGESDDNARPHPSGSGIIASAPPANAVAMCCHVFSE
jgi:hypothetical protein